METFWFVAAACMVAAYVILDGYDLGAGILHLFVARDERERALVLRSIAPFWDGNEVWLLAGGGVIVMAFPLLYATAFSGFYLPLMLVLWLLIGRALGIELRHQVHHPLWEAFWDRIFAVSSALLVVCYGAALGNVVRGVPLDEQGRFFLPLWADSERRGILDPYPVLVGLAALAALAMHGGTWIAHRLEGEVQARARRAARIAAIAVAVLTGVVTLWTFDLQPHVPQRLGEQPWIHGCAALAVAGLAGVFLALRRGRDGLAFLCSSAYLLGMLTSAVFGLYPYVLPATTGAARSLTVHSAAAGPIALRTGAAWFVPGILLAIAYQVVTYRVLRGKVRAEGATPERAPGA
jgi:cytochrome d ubiquinol oxidase subunit II